jgi:hypothetical protein
MVKRVASPYFLLKRGIFFETFSYETRKTYYIRIMGRLLFIKKGDFHMLIAIIVLIVFLAIFTSKKPGAGSNFPFFGGGNGDNDGGSDGGFDGGGGPDGGG